MTKRLGVRSFFSDTPLMCPLNEDSGRRSQVAELPLGELAYISQLEELLREALLPSAVGEPGSISRHPPPFLL